MPYYCFNVDCEKWGDEIPQKPIGVNLTYRFPLIYVTGWTDCPNCGELTYWHDNWDKDERTHDDGSPCSA